jgi:hypothetical protein
MYRWCDKAAAPKDQAAKYHTYGLALLTVFGSGEKGDACRITVKKIFAAHRTDLSLCKEARDRNRSDAFLHHPAIVMGMAEQAFAPPAAAEQQRTQGRIPVL